ncbi:hypothetical protein IFT54_05500 [Sphingomonas sp. CFBP 13714]|uniref:hypothetical protein n=1 Tax=Sphingomonas sp. CFBP 13714 TaxID=2775308 RepID=UPI0017831CAE|nr:hypothetical protein [Sphingomonas sp. CFBP 13714]MBD8699270.1 hypothetical protein [Sphingomonas sp. CFBP 13714]
MAISADDLNIVLQQVKDLMVDFTAKMLAWTSGVAGGGPNSDGKYPLPTGFGTYTNTACPAQLAMDSQKIAVANNGTITLGMTAGYTAEGNAAYTFKPADSGKVFMMLSANNAATNTISLWLPDNLPAGWNVSVIQMGNSRLRFRKVGDTTNTNANLRNRQGFFTTAGLGSLAIAFCESLNSAGANAFYTIGGDVNA